MIRNFILIVTILFLISCATTSTVMEIEGGAYMISSYASKIRGGATGATDRAFNKAMEFCAEKGKRAVIASAEERDVYQSAMGGSFNQSGGGFGGGKFAAGNANLIFKCE